MTNGSIKPNEFVKTPVITKIIDTVHTVGFVSKSKLDQGSMMGHHLKRTRNSDQDLVLRDWD